MLTSYQQNANIWGNFGSKYGYLTPRGGHTERYSLLFGDSFSRNTIMLCCECHNVAALHHLIAEMWQILLKHQYFRSFFVKIGEFNPPGVYKCGRLVLVFDSFHQYSVLVCLEWFCMHIRHISSDRNCEKLIFQPFLRQNFGV